MEMSRVTQELVMAKTRTQVILFLVGKLEKIIKTVKHKSYTKLVSTWKRNENHGQNACSQCKGASPGAQTKHYRYVTHSVQL